ncbi:MAG: hypothetical protein IJV98_00965 [Clostridia bacterium]|nr:hypothetical protein [Clostridia bacterium]
MSEHGMTGREVLMEAMRQYDRTYCEQYPPITGEKARRLHRERTPLTGYMARFGKRAAMLVCALGILFGCMMSRPTTAVGGCATVYPFKTENVLIDNIECSNRSEYTEDTVYVHTFIRSMRGADTVTLETRACVSVTYTTGETVQSHVATAEKTVSESHDGTYASVQFDYDPTKAVSHFSVYYWYYVDGIYLFASNYTSAYGIDNY